MGIDVSDIRLMTYFHPFWVLDGMVIARLQTDTSPSRVGDVVRGLDKMAPEVEDLHVTRCVKISSFLFFAKQRSRTQLRRSSRAVL